MNELKKKKFIIHITLRYWLGSKEGLRRQQFGDLNVFLVVVAVVVGSSGSCSITWTVIRPYGKCLSKMFLLAKHEVGLPSRNLTQNTGMPLSEIVHKLPFLLYIFHFHFLLFLNKFILSFSDNVSKFSWMKTGQRSIAYSKITCRNHS